MKKSHESFERFPQEKVRSAIRSGIVRAQVENSQPEMLKKNKGKRKVLYSLTSVAAVFILLLISSHFSPSIASSLSQIPIIGSVFGNSDLVGLQKAQQNGLAIDIGETKTVNGISVTLYEILYDQNNISISLIIESDKQLDEFYFGAGMDFTINGKRPSATTGSYGEEVISETTRTVIQNINVTEEMPEKFELGLILRGENGEKWYFSTPVKKIHDIQNIPIEHTETVDGLELTITEISVSPTGLSIAYESVEEETDFDLSRGGYIDFHVVDQDGLEITGYSGGTYGELENDKIVHESRKQFDPLEEHVTQITITPYMELPSSGGGVEIDKNGNERELAFKGHLLKPIEFTSITVEIP